MSTKSKRRKHRGQPRNDPDLQEMQEDMEGWTIVEILPGRRPESVCIFSLKKDISKKQVHLHATDLGIWITKDS